MNSSIEFALLLSALAGLSTAVGGLLGITVREPGPRFMSFTLGFSGGVMILVAFVELLQKGMETVGFAPAYLAFVGGMLGMFVIDVAIPHQYMAERYNTGSDGFPGRCVGRPSPGSRNRRSHRSPQHPRRIGSGGSGLRSYRKSEQSSSLVSSGRTCGCVGGRGSLDANTEPGGARLRTCLRSRDHGLHLAG